MLRIRSASLMLALAATGVPTASGQTMLREVMARHGVQLPGGNFERGFDEGLAPATPDRGVVRDDELRHLAADKCAEGRDATALAVAFARERLLRDGSVATLRLALDDPSRRAQALGYLAELGVSTP